ncbi:MAG: winged helix-turn-helix transcriptional regulator [Candidatus Kaiserbacteria bacterium]|nr:winged helix-turn-helix transcriptional regulator [Candidatus Kaiserbacteria bacterium]
MISKAHKARAEHAAQLFGLVSSATRVRILTTLMKKKELSVQDIAKNLNMTHSAVSHQLGLLSEANIVSSKKLGRLMCYRIASGKEAKALIKFLSSLS